MATPSAPAGGTNPSSSPCATAPQPGCRPLRPCLCCPLNSAFPGPSCSHPDSSAPPSIPEQCFLPFSCSSSSAPERLGQTRAGAGGAQRPPAAHPLHGAPLAGGGGAGSTGGAGALPWQGGGTAQSPAAVPCLHRAQAGCGHSPSRRVLVPAASHPAGAGARARAGTPSPAEGQRGVGGQAGGCGGHRAMGLWGAPCQGAVGGTMPGDVGG